MCVTSFCGDMETTYKVMTIARSTIASTKQKYENGDSNKPIHDQLEYNTNEKEILKENTSLINNEDK